MEESSSPDGSTYLGASKKKLVPQEPEYIYLLEVLGAMPRQEDRQGIAVGEGRGRRNATVTSVTGDVQEPV